MSNNPRDTQFQGFAHALLMELVAGNAMALNWDKFFPEVEQIIARRAYDLVEHTLDHAPVREWALPCQGSDIPDMTELPKKQDMYFIDNGDCHGAQALERLEPPKEQSTIKINRLDGSCPVQAMGTIENHSAFYFRGRHEQWQFVAGPKELNTNDLVEVQLGMTQDSRVFVLEGDDEDRDYLDYDHVRCSLRTYAQQYIEWMNERKGTNEKDQEGQV